MTGHGDDDGHSGQEGSGGHGGHDEHESHESHGGHHGFDLGQWLEEHLSGIIVPFGKKAEKVIEQTMVLSVNRVFLKLAVFFLVILTPVVCLEFVLHAARL